MNCHKERQFVTRQLAEPTGIGAAIANFSAAQNVAAPERRSLASAPNAACEFTDSPLRNSAGTMAHRLAADRAGGVAAPDRQEFSFF